MNIKPCRNKCAPLLKSKDDRCPGCLRTESEIRDWPEYSVDTQIDKLVSLIARAKWKAKTKHKAYYEKMAEDHKVKLKRIKKGRKDKYERQKVAKDFSIFPANQSSGAYVGYFNTWYRA